MPGAERYQPPARIAKDNAGAWNVAGHPVAGLPKDVEACKAQFASFRKQLRVSDDYPTPVSKAS